MYFYLLLSCARYTLILCLLQPEWKLNFAFSGGTSAEEPCFPICSDSYVIAVKNLRLFLHSKNLKSSTLFAVIFPSNSISLTYPELCQFSGTVPQSSSIVMNFGLSAENTNRKTAVAGNKIQ